MQTFKTFITKKSLNESITSDHIETFNQLLTIALTQGPLTKGSSAFKYLSGELEDTLPPGKFNLDMFDIFANYFNKMFHGIKPKIKEITSSLANLNTSEKNIVVKETKRFLKELGTRWSEITTDAIKLKSTDKTAGYISVDPNFAKAILTLLSSTDINSPEVKFFLPAF